MKISKVAVFLIMLFAAVEAWALPGSPYGDCGNNVNWKFENGTLTISGTGPMDNRLAFNRNDWPWHEYSSGNESEQDWYLFYSARVTKIIVEDGVTEIGHHAFRNFSRLESVTIADSVTSIKNNAFYSCPNLRSINLGNGVKTIEWNVFEGCSALTEITLPATVETIGDNAFQSCSNLKTVTFKTPASQHNLAIQNNFNDSDAVVRYDGECSLFYENNRVLQGTPMRFLSAKTLVLRPYDNTQLVSEGMCGSNMSWELNDKDHILAIKFYDPAVFGVKENNVDKSIYNYKNATEVPWYPYRNDLKGVTIEEGVTRIGDYAFSDCKAITDIVIPSTVNEIGVSAFKDCAALKDIVFPSSLNRIGASAFQNCVALKTVTFIVPSSISGKINFGENSFGNTTAVIRYDGEGVLKNESLEDCVTTGSTLSDLGRNLHSRFAWFPNSSISFTVKADDIVVLTKSGTEFSTTFRLVNKFGLIRDVKWSINTDVTAIDKNIHNDISTFSGGYKAEITESSDNSANVKFFVESPSERVNFFTKVTASCGDISREGLAMIMFNPSANASAASVNSVHSAADENATLNGKIGDTLTASFEADPDFIWTLIPDSGTAEHAETLDITLNGDTAEVEAVFDRRGEYNSIVVAKNSSGDIVDVDSLTFTVTDDGNFTLAPEGLYFNAAVSEPKDASIRIKSANNVDGIKWGVFWDEEPTNSTITSNDSGINITAEWDTPGEYHALVTADSEECFDYTILTFSVAKTNIFELLLDKLFFSGTAGEEFEDASVLISGDVNPSDIEWTLNFDGKVISEEELNFLYNDEGASASPIFSSEGEHQIQIIASKGDCTRSVTFTFIAEAESGTSNAVGSSGGGCNTGLGTLTLLTSVIMVFRKKS